MASSGERETAIVEWRQLPAEDVARPIVETLPYLELKLEHPDLEATGRREQFFPDAVPYELGGERRVCYWRPALEAGGVRPADWTLACATTHSLAGIDELPAVVPPLAGEEADDGVRHAVVGGTVAGDATTVGLSGYELPAVRIESCWTDGLTISIDGRSIRLDPGARRSIDLDSRRVTLAADGETAVTQPQLSVRFPGERTLYHPAPAPEDGAGFRCFPSFGLDLSTVASPLAVPTTVGELDHEALAARLGVDLAERPYPERVLWQAFAHVAFDPHAGGTAMIGQLDIGQLDIDQPDAELLVVEPAEPTQADRTASSSSS